MAKTEAMSHKITKDFCYLLRKYKSLLIRDSLYSLSATDFFVLIEVTKTMIDFTVTFNLFAKQISNFSFFFSSFDLQEHKLFLKNYKYIYKKTNELFLLNRRTFGGQNKIIAHKDFCMYQFRIHQFKPLRMPANGQNINNFVQRYAKSVLLFPHTRLLDH
jgi:hypothetical protein